MPPRRPSTDFDLPDANHRYRRDRSLEMSRQRHGSNDRLPRSHSISSNYRAKRDSRSGETPSKNHSKLGRDRVEGISRYRWREEKDSYPPRERHFSGPVDRTTTATPSSSSLAREKSPSDRHRYHRYHDPTPPRRRERGREWRRRMSSHSQAQSPGGYWNRSLSRETSRPSSRGERDSRQSVLCRPLSQSPGKHWNLRRDLSRELRREPGSRGRGGDVPLPRSLSRNSGAYYHYEAGSGRERETETDGRDGHRSRSLGKSHGRCSAEENVNRLLSEVSKFKQEEQTVIKESRRRSMSPKRMLRWKKNVKEHYDDGEMNKLLDEVGKFQTWLNDRDDPKLSRYGTPVKFSSRPRPRSTTPSGSLSRDTTPATRSIIKQDCDRRYPTPPQKQDPPETLVIDAPLKREKHKKLSSQSSSATASTTLISSISGTASFGDSNADSYENNYIRHGATNDSKIDNFQAKRMGPNHEIVCTSENGAGVSQLGSVPSDSVKTDYILELLENQMNSLMFATDFIKEEFLKDISKNGATDEGGVHEKDRGRQERKNNKRLDEESPHMKHFIKCLKSSPPRSFKPIRPTATAARSEERLNTPPPRSRSRRDPSPSNGDDGYNCQQQKEFYASHRHDVDKFDDNYEPEAPIRDRHRSPSRSKSPRDRYTTPPRAISPCNSYRTPTPQWSPSFDMDSCQSPCSSLTSCSDSEESFNSLSHESSSSSSGQSLSPSNLQSKHEEKKSPSRHVESKEKGQWSHASNGRHELSKSDSALSFYSHDRNRRQSIATLDKYEEYRSSPVSSKWQDEETTMPYISESSTTSFDGTNGHREVKLDAAPPKDRRDPPVVTSNPPASSSRPIRHSNEESTASPPRPSPPPTLIHEGTTLIPYNDETDPSSKKASRPSRSRSSDRERRHGGHRRLANRHHDDDDGNDHHQPRRNALSKERRRSDHSRESRTDRKSHNDSETTTTIDKSNNNPCHNPRPSPTKDERRNTTNTPPIKRRGKHVLRMPYTDPFGDFGHYTGEVDDQRRPHGRGKMKYDNGIFFEGKWTNGRHDSMTHADRNKLLGGFTSWKGQMTRNGSRRRHVYGMEWIDVNGMSGTYTGTVDENSLPNGKGVMKYSMGLVAEGEWVRGILHGCDKHLAGIGAPLDPLEASSMIGRTIVGEMTYVSGLGMTSVCDPRARNHQFD